MIERVVRITLRRIGGLAWDHPSAAAALVAGLVVLGGWGATGLRIDFSSASFYASGDAASELHRFADRWGPDDNVLMVVVRANEGDLLTRNRIETIGRLAEALGQVPAVRDVSSVATQRVAPPGEPFDRAQPVWALPPLDPAGPMTRDELLARLPFVPLLLSTDARSAAVVVELAISSDDPAALLPVVERLASVLDDFAGVEGLAFEMAGVPAVRASFVPLTRGDQIVLVPASLLVVGLSLFWFFRRLHGVLIPGAAALLPLVLLLGVMGWTGEPIGLLNQAYFTLIPVLALSDAVHLLARYHEERRRHDAREAVLLAVEHAGLACTLATATTAMAFLSLAIGSPPMLGRFGLFAAAGMGAAYATVFVLIPVCLRVSHALPSPDGQRPWLSAMARLSTRRPALVVAVAMLVTVALVAAGSRVTVDNRLSGLLRADHPVREAGAVLDSSLGGTLSLEVELEGDEGAFLRPAVVNATAAFEDWAMTEPGVRAVLGPGRSLEFIAAATGLVLGSPEAIGTAYDRLADEVDPARMVSPDRGRARVSIRVAEGGGRAFAAFATHVQDEATATFAPVGIQPTVTGTTLLAYRGVNAIGSAIQQSLLLQFAVIAAMFGALFRSLPVTLVALVANALPVLAGYGTLGVLGLDLDPLSGTILAFGVGIAVDDTIHVLVRIRERVQAGDDLPVAIATALTRSGRAVAITTIVIGAGLALNLLSSFPPLALLGLLGGVVMLTALVSDLLLLPALLVVFGLTYGLGRSHEAPVPPPES
ncbi:MAG TPA: MMPL family transporter [Vicinamibacterales bacterium]|nr:MMPL family transporter [Vicinamibacterales bacterium]